MQLPLIVSATTIYPSDSGWLLAKGSIIPWEARSTFRTNVPSADGLTELPVDEHGKYWYESSYDDSTWTPITGGIGNQNWCNTFWQEDNSAYWLRTDFQLKAVNPDAEHSLWISHDDDVLVYLNGYNLTEHHDCCSDSWTPVSYSYLKEGLNTIAVYVYNGEGDSYIDFGIWSEDVNNETDLLQFTIDNISYISNGDSEVSVRSVTDKSCIIIPETIEYGGDIFNVTQISKSAFDECSQVREMFLPASITNFSFSLNGCSNLVRLTTATTTPPTISSNGLKDNLHIFVPDASVSTYKSSELWSTYDINAVSNYDKKTYEGDLFYDNGLCFEVRSVEGETAVVCGWGDLTKVNYDGDITIPDVVVHHNKEFKITAISHFVFRDVQTINKVVLGKNIKWIDGGAFTRSSLSSIVFNDGLETLYWEAFSECTNLESIDIPSSVTVIEHDCFNGCTSLVNVVLPDALTILEDHVFAE